MDTRNLDAYCYYLYVDVLAKDTEGAQNNHEEQKCLESPHTSPIEVDLVSERVVAWWWVAW